MRRVFLWAARNSWLQAHLPNLWFMRRAVRRFMLGENLESLAEADAGVAHYLELTDRIVAAGIHGEISVKPTQLGLDHDPAACLANVLRLAEHAAAAGSFLWIDMEGSAYTEATVALYEQVKAVQPKTGICLQAYLKRTAADIERLLPLDPAIRLVKGASDEPAAIAYRDRRGVDANYLGLAVRFLLDGRGQPIRLGLGTHD